MLVPEKKIRSSKPLDSGAFGSIERALYDGVQYVAVKYVKSRSGKVNFLDPEETTQVWQRETLLHSFWRMVMRSLHPHLTGRPCRNFSAR